MSLTARAQMDFDIRFDYDYPTFSSSVICSNNNIQVSDYTATPFGAKFTIKNLTDEHQLVQGEIDKNKSKIKENFMIFGKALHKGQESQVTRTTSAINATDEVQFDSKWIQDKGTADSLADWAQKRFDKPRKKITIGIVGNPLIEIADIITLQHPDINVDRQTEFLVKKVRLTWENGLQTELEVVEI